MVVYFWLCRNYIYTSQLSKNFITEENKESFEGEKQENKVDKKQDLYNYLDSTKFALSLLVVISTFIGTLSYMGGKKIEYGKKFTYSRFFFGVPKCRGKSPPNMGYLHNIMAAFK